MSRSSLGATGAQLGATGLGWRANSGILPSAQGQQRIVGVGGHSLRRLKSEERAVREELKADKADDGFGRPSRKKKKRRRREQPHVGMGSGKNRGVESRQQRDAAAHAEGELSLSHERMAQKAALYEAAQSASARGDLIDGTEKPDSGRFLVDFFRKGDADEPEGPGGFVPPLSEPAEPPVAAFDPHAAAAAWGAMTPDEQQAAWQNPQPAPPSEDAFDPLQQLLDDGKREAASASAACERIGVLEEESAAEADPMAALEAGGAVAAVVVHR